MLISNGAPVKMNHSALIRMGTPLDEETRRELKRIEDMAKEGVSVAYRAESAWQRHEAVCAERYGNLQRLLEGMRDDLKSVRALPWKYVAGGVVIIGGFLSLKSALGL